MSSAGHRHILKHGHDVVLKNYAEGGKDAYEDATLIVTNSTVVAIREMRVGPADVIRDESGAIPVGETIFHVKDTITVMVGTVPTVSTIAVSDGSATQASELVDGGATYTAIQRDDLGNGVIVVVAERNRA